MVSQFFFPSNLFSSRCDEDRFTSSYQLICSSFRRFFSSFSRLAISSYCLAIVPCSLCSLIPYFLLVRNTPSKQATHWWVKKNTSNQTPKEIMTRKWNFIIRIFYFIIYIIHSWCVCVHRFWIGASSVSRQTSCLFNLGLCVCVVDTDVHVGCPIQGKSIEFVGVISQVVQSSAIFRKYIFIMRFISCDADNEFPTNTHIHTESMICWTVNCKSNQQT